MQIKNPNNTNSLGDLGQKRRQDFLLHPTESPEVDYKEGLKLEADTPFARSLVKHVLGMCNAGGGYLVIGYKENEQKQPEPSDLEDEVIASYDPSFLAGIVEKYTAGTEKINLKIHKEKHPTTGKIYPIVEVFGFEKRPFFCKSSADSLKEGALYLRVASARTVNIATPDDWDKLIDLCVEKRQSDMLKRFASLAQEMGIVGKNSFLSENERIVMQKNEWVLDQQKKIKEINEKYSFEFSGLEASHWPETLDGKLTSKDLLSAAEKAVRRNTGWPIGLVMRTPEHRPIPEQNGVRGYFAANDHGLDYWNFLNDGSYYFFRTFEEDRKRDWFGEHIVVSGPDKQNQKMMFFDTRIWRVAELVDHCIALYKELGVSPETKIVLNVNHLGLNDRKLNASDPRRAFSMNHDFSRTGKVEWTKTVSLDFLETERNNIISEICRELFMIFDLWDPAPGVIEGVINDYDTSRVR